MDTPPSRPEQARLDALRRQRDLIARHLAWLDEEIAQTAGYLAPPIQPPSTYSPPSLPPLPPLPQLAPSPSTSQTTPPIPVPSAETAPAAPRARVTIPPFPEPASGLSASDKWGCIIIVAVIAVAILGAIWVLPFFMHHGD